MSTSTALPPTRIPTGTITFLFTDIEGSTKRWEQYPRAMQAAMALHNVLLREAIEANGGYVFKTVGDAFCAAFSTAPQALDAALAGQRALLSSDWGPVGPIKVRMALHTGVAELHDNDYFGQPLNRVARLLSTGYGGQVLLSLATEQLVRDDLPRGVTLRDLGEGGLRDLAHPEHVYQVLTADLPSVFPPLKSLDTRYVGPTEAGGAAGAALYNPYKGLRAFQETDAPDFFGREALTAMLLQRLADSGPLCRFLAVVGPSGSGKSSVVRAGLVPALRQGKLPGSERWLIVEILPGSHPLEELEAVLLNVAVNPPPSLMEQLQSDERGLIRAAKRVLPHDESVELVLVIDQFEEVFTLVEDEPSRVHFLELLCAAVSDPRSRIRIIVTLRADFFDRPLLYPDPGELMRQRTAVVLPLSGEELERAIVEPARRVGVSLEPELLAAIIKDVGEQIGSLPLLEYALTELFEQRKGKVLTLEAYQASGGVTGALARRAEEIYEGLTPDEKEACRQLFLRLVTLGEGAEDTRRRVRRAELTSLVGDSGALDRVIERYGRYRLLTFDMDPVTKGPTVEVAHEALIRTWVRYREWLEDSRTDLRVQRQLTTEAAEWEHAGRDPSYLAAGTRLGQFEALAADVGKPGGVALTTEEKEYLASSGEERKRQETAEHERQAKELTLQKRAASRLRTLLVGAVVFLLVVGILAVWALNQSNVAQANLTHSEAMRWAVEANSLLVQNQSPETVALLALRSMNTEYTPQGDAALAGAMNLTLPLHVLKTPDLLSPWSPVSLGGGTLLDKYVLTGDHTNVVRVWDVQAGKEVQHFAHSAGVRYAVFSPDGKYVLTGCDDQIARLWDVQTGKEVRRFVGHTDGIGGVAFSHNGKYVLTSGFSPDTTTDSTLRIWDAAIGKEISRFQTDVATACVAFLPGDTRFVSLDGATCWWLARDPKEIKIRIRDVATGEIAHEFRSFNMPVWSPDGSYRYLLTQAEKEKQLWDTDTGNKLASFPIPNSSTVLGNAAISTDGMTVLTGDADGAVKLWDTRTGAVLRTFAGPKSVSDVALSPGNRMVAAVDQSTNGWLWDAQSGALLRRFSGIWALVFSSDGQYLLTRIGDTSLTLWQTVALNGLPQFSGHEAGVNAANFSPDGKFVVTGAYDKTARVWDAHTGQLLRVLSGHTGVIGWLAMLPDSKRVLTAGYEGTVRLWDLQTGRQLHQFDFNGMAVAAVAVSRDGRYALANVQTRMEVYDLQTYALVQTLTTGDAVRDQSIGGLAFSPDGKLAVTSVSYPDYPLRLWDISTGKLLREFKGLTTSATGLVFSPDGKYILSGDTTSRTATLWDVATGQIVRRFTGHTDAVYGVAFSHDGKLAATSSADNTARIWDVATGRELRRLVGHTATIWQVEFSPDDKTVITASDDWTARLWYVDYHDEMRYLCGKLLRDFTDAERVQYEIKDTTPTCPANAK